MLKLDNGDFVFVASRDEKDGIGNVVVARENAEGH